MLFVPPNYTERRRFRQDTEPKSYWWLGLLSVDYMVNLVVCRILLQILSQNTALGPEFLATIMSLILFLIVSLKVMSRAGFDSHATTY